MADSLGLSELLDITSEQNVNLETTKKHKMLHARILCFIRKDIRSALLECDLPSQIIAQLKNRFDKQNQFHIAPKIPLLMEILKFVKKRCIRLKKDKMSTSTKKVIKFHKIRMEHFTNIETEFSETINSKVFRPEDVTVWH